MEEEEGGGFVELGHFNKHFKNMSKIQEKEGPQGNILEIFLLDTLETKFQMENLTQQWTHSGLFFPKSISFLFQFSLRAGEASPLRPNCAPVSVTQYASISLNTPKCP